MSGRFEAIDFPKIPRFINENANLFHTYSIAKKMVWDTHTVSLDPGLSTSPVVTCTTLYKYTIMFELQKQWS